MRGNGGGLYATGGQLTMSDTRFVGNFIETNGNGGGAFVQVMRAPLELDRIVATGNLVQGTSAGNGGALWLGSVDAARLSRSRIEGNRAVNGGGLSASGTNLVIEDTNLENNAADFEAGGAILSMGQVRLERVGLLENRAEFTGGLKTSGASAVLRNSTISGNVAQLHSGLTLGGTSELYHVTIAHNRDRSDGFMAGALHLDPAGDAQLNSVLLSRNFVQPDAAVVRGRASNCYVDSRAVLSSRGYNLSNDGTCRALDATTDRHDTPAGEDPILALHGAPFRSHALLPGSAAIDAGDPQRCPAVDQRGAPRVNRCDIGAFEFGASAPAVGPMVFQTARSRTPTASRSTARP
jgi:hypothetical protein